MRPPLILRCNLRRRPAGHCAYRDASGSRKSICHNHVKCASLLRRTSRSLFL